MAERLQQKQTELQASENSLLEANENLRVRNNFIETLLDNIQYGILAFDMQGYVRIANSQISEMFDIKKTTHRKIGHLPTFTAMCRGKMRHFSIRLFILKDEDVTPIGILAVFHDLTEIDRSTRAKAWQEVARRIAHEIKNPLTPIQLSAQRIRSRFIEKQESDLTMLEKSLDTIIKEVGLLKGIVNEFENFARIPEIQLKKINIETLTDSVIELFRPGLENRIILTKKISGSIPEILADAEHINRVMINLITNAVSAIESITDKYPGEMGNIEIRLSCKDNNLLLDIADNGSGVTLPDPQQIFEPYVTTRKNGTGLGLAIVRRIIADHDGFIRFEHNTPRGNEGYRVLTLASGKFVSRFLEKEEADLILLDIWMEDCDGVDVLGQLKEKHTHIPVIMISGHGDVETAVKTTKMGAYDFIEKPPDYHKMMLTVKHALQESTLRKQNTQLKLQINETVPPLIGEHPLIKALYKEIQTIAPTEARVLIYGENGTGKEVVARQIHAHSPRAEQAFVEVNCAAIPEELIESELFGHEKGAFTGADRKKTGKFDQANNGTLFLDEIADMSGKTQAKILRVLQEQRFERVGGNQPVQVNVRIIAASNKRLEDEIAAGRFREDLYYRLNILPLVLPPLRERAADIPLLVNYFCQFFRQTANYPLKIFDRGVFDIFESYPWPGNVRELKNIVERMLIISPGKILTTKDVPPAITMAVKGKQPAETAPDESLFDIKSGLPQTIKEAREVFEKQFIERLLRQNNYNISKTAELIGMERSHLHKKIRQYGIKN
ncbi:hypothetical protein CHS0354_030097 [Potamilus streckersoni]|uniref:Uncharacterized protein n=1 Tax=Potamilus streckersoni TaxID=2493646 RepID=A0AAE0RLW1_9BIVA|nr:hypothetical protein CHS0354_030097 [Potamilus streckersoni]